MKIILMGPPGSGKGSQCVRLRERYPDLCYINPMETVREEVQRQTPQGMAALQSIQAGDILSDDLLAEILLRRMAACPKGYVLDGAPRGVPLAERLVAAGEVVDAIVRLRLPERQVADRIGGRWIHRASGRIYHERYAPPKKAGVDDVTGDALVQRNDDKPEVVAQRVQAYEAEEDALLAFYATTERSAQDARKAQEEAIKRAAAAMGKADADVTKATTAGDARALAAAEQRQKEAMAAVATAVAAPDTDAAPRYEPRLFQRTAPLVATVDGAGSLDSVRQKLLQTLDQFARKRPAAILLPDPSAGSAPSGRWWWPF